MTTTMTAGTTTRCAEAKAAAEARFAAKTAEERAAAEAFTASITGRLARCFVGEGNSKGRQLMYTATEAEAAAFYAARTA